MSILNRACCCCHLSTAAVLLGWLGSIGYFITAVSVVVALADGNSNYSGDNVFDIMRTIVLCVALLISFLNLVGCACLMVGAIKKIRQLILPWLFGQIVFIIVLIFSDIVYLVNLFGHEHAEVVPPFCLLTTYLAFQIYFWVCVYSLFHEIREGDVEQHGAESRKTTTVNDELPPYSSL